MKYQYRFKDKSLEQALNVIYGEEFVEDEVNRQMTNTTSYICFDIDHSSTTISKGEIAEINEYNPDAWNPFPKVTPKSDIVYLVTLRTPAGQRVVTKSLYLAGFGWRETFNLEVIAFREFPKPYNPREDD